MNDTTPPAPPHPAEVAPGSGTDFFAVDAAAWTAHGQQPQIVPVNTGATRCAEDGTSRADLPDLDSLETALMSRGGTGHDARGKFTPGNREAVKTLRYTRRWPPELLAEVDTFFRNSISDDGGHSEIATRRLSLHRYRSEVHGLVLATGAAIKRHGLEDRHGRIRLPWVKQYESLVRTAMQIDQVLGLDRRQRDALSIHDYMAQAQPIDAPEAPRDGAWGESGSDRELPSEGDHD